MRIVILLLLLVASYIVGCFVGAYYIGHWRRGADIRKSGSGNAGARNMARVHGPVDAALTLLFDAAKGAAAAWLGLWLIGTEWAALAALTAAIVGHIWPVQLGWHGGKGAAAGLGGMAVLDPTATLLLLAVGAVAFALSRRFTASGLLAIALAAPALAVRGHPAATVALAAVASLICLAVQHPVFDQRRRPAEGQVT